MRKFAIASTVVLVTVSSAWFAFGERNAKEESPHRAVVVIEGVYSRERVGQFAAISVIDPKTIEALEKFFPNYRQHPSSDMAAGWESGATVYFDFRDGRSIRITVSQNEDMKWWTVDKGDFEVNGNFAAYLKQLREIGERDTKR